MSVYIRPKSSGATIFFTVCLADRKSDLMVREIALLREAVRVTRAERPFEIVAWVVLPEHLHCIWRLPPGDGGYSVRWGAIKSRFTMSLRRSGFTLPPDLPVVQRGRYAGLKPGLRMNKRERAVWQRRFWGEARSEIDPVDRFQCRTGEAPAAKLIMCAAGTN